MILYNYDVSVVAQTKNFALSIRTEVIWCKHTAHSQASMMTVNSPHKGQWRGALMFSLIYAWINDWVNNREAGDLRRQRGHYDVILCDAKFPTSL